MAVRSRGSQFLNRLMDDLEIVSLKQWSHVLPLRRLQVLISVGRGVDLRPLVKLVGLDRLINPATVSGVGPSDL
jgi:hypothetical protein